MDNDEEGKLDPEFIFPEERKGTESIADRKTAMELPLVKQYSAAVIRALSK